MNFKGLVFLFGGGLVLTGCVVSPFPPMPSAYIVYAPNYPVNVNDGQAKLFADGQCAQIGKTAVPKTMPNCGYGNCTTVYECQ